MKDLINRLRGVANNARLIGAYIGGGQRYLEEEAADALEAQQAEIEALQAEVVKQVAGSHVVFDRDVVKRAQAARRK